MKIIGNHPKTPDWTLKRFSQNGRYVFLTGDYSHRGVCSYTPDRVEEVSNVLIEGCFIRDKKSKYVFLDADTGDSYWITKNMQSKFLQAFMDEYLCAKDGMASGIFTFAKEGSAVSLCPYMNKRTKINYSRENIEVPYDALSEADIMAGL